MMNDQPHQLLILRHAKAATDSHTGRDFDRPLAPRGERDCEHIGQRIAQSGLAPHQVLCSAAARTQATWLGIAAQLEQPTAAPTMRRNLYGCDYTDWISLLRSQSDDHQRVLVIGHNPEMQSLLIHLVGSQVTPASNGKIMPTATLAILTIDSDWTHLSDRCATLVDIIRPRDL